MSDVRAPFAQFPAVSNGQPVPYFAPKVLGGSCPYCNPAALGGAIFAAGAGVKAATAFAANAAAGFGLYTGGTLAPLLIDYVWPLSRPHHMHVTRAR